MNQTKPKNNKTKPKNNIFLFSPGGYPPLSRLYFWADHIEPENVETNIGDNNDEWWDAAHEFTSQQDVDYGCYFMSRKELIETLKNLLEE